MTEMPKQANIADLPNLQDLPDHTMRRFSGQNVMIQVATSPAGSSFEAHSHHNEQLVYVLEGRIRLHLGDDSTGITTYELAKGDLLAVPPHMPYSGETLEDTVALDAFTPPRTSVMGESEE
ncbi:MAG: cupin domain-containing protein [Pseudomonadota bacterium]